MYKVQDLESAFFRTTLLTQLYVRVGILLTYRKYLYDHIIALSQQSERYYVCIRVRTIVQASKVNNIMSIRVMTIVLSQQSERYYAYTC